MGVIGYRDQLWARGFPVVELITTKPRGCCLAMVGDPVLTGLSAGDHLDIVVHIRSSDLHGAYMVAIWNHETCRCSGSFGVDRIYTLYGVQYQGLFGEMHHLHVKQDTVVVLRPLLDERSYRTAKEVCAGIGGISLGLQQLGGSSLVVSDHNQLACEVLRDNFPNVVEGDLADRSTRLQLHQVSPEIRSMLCASIPTLGPPRSGLGPCPGDSRWVLLRHILQLAWHTQASCLILAGPVAFAKHPQFQRLLGEFATKAGLRLHQVELDLADQWASSRVRWWAVLLPTGLPQMQLHRWPVQPCPPVVQDVIPDWPVWPEAEEANLKWDAQELQAFADPALGSEHTLEASCQAPVALHSWGNAFRPCPCGCRSKPFSIEGMKAQGLKGIGVPSQAQPGMRFLHPLEAGLLNSLPLTFRYSVQPRAALCLVGQLTAPLQAVWICASVAQTVAPCFGSSPPDPAQELSRFTGLLLQQRKDFWLLPSMLFGGVLALCDANGPRTEVASGPVTAGQLASAEAALLPPGFKVQVSLHGRVLPRTARLVFAPDGPEYQLSVQRKAAALDSDCLRATLGPIFLKNTDCSSAGPSRPDLVGCTALPRPAPLPHPLEALRTATASDFTLWYGIELWINSPLASDSFRLVPPCAADTLLQLLGEDFQLPLPDEPVLPQGPRILIPFASAGHWALLVLLAGPAGVEATLWDGVPGRCSNVARRLAQIFCSLDRTALLSFVEEHHWLQEDPHACGAYTLAHAAALVLGCPDPTLLEWALDFLIKFPPHLSGLCGSGGLSTEQEKELQELLITKGVPAAEAVGRVQAAVAKVGAGPIGHALQQRNPWQALKTCASKPQCMFKWVHSDELQAHVAQRAHTKFGTEIPRAKTKKGKAAQRPTQAPLHIDPAQLRLSPGSFVASSGTPLGQLSFEEVKAQATGVCFCSVAQAMPFVAHARNLSVDPLALITTAEIPEEQVGKARLAPVKYPAIFTPTQEAVLVTGTLVQLGDDSVQLASTNISEIEHLDTIVCRLCSSRTKQPSHGISWSRLPSVSFCNSFRRFRSAGIPRVTKHAQLFMRRLMRSLSSFSWTFGLANGAASMAPAPKQAMLTSFRRIFECRHLPSNTCSGPRVRASTLNLGLRTGRARTLRGPWSGSRATLLPRHTLHSAQRRKLLHLPALATNMASGPKRQTSRRCLRPCDLSTTS